MEADTTAATGILADTDASCSAAAAAAACSQDALLLCVAHDCHKYIEAAHHYGYGHAPEASHTHLKRVAHVHAKNACAQITATTTAASFNKFWNNSFRLPDYACSDPTGGRTVGAAGQTTQANAASPACCNMSYPDMH